MAGELHFLFSASDQSRIEVLSNEDVAEDFVDNITRNTTGLRHAQALTLRMRINDGNDSPPQIRPLFAGEIRFIRNELGGGIVPDPSSGDISEDDYDSWATTGALLVDGKFLDRKIATLAPQDELKPNLVWYSEVQITKKFLFDTLIESLKKRRTIKLPFDDPRWWQFAISNFLEGKYAPNLILPDGSDAIPVSPMPELLVGSDDRSTLTVIAARMETKPWDASSAAFDADDFGRDKMTFPGHRINGRIPARAAYWRMRQHMSELDSADPGATSPIADAIVGDASNNYHEFTFTRSAVKSINFSSLLSNLAVVIKPDGGGQERRLALPAHGRLFLKGAPASGSIRLENGVRWLKALDSNVRRRVAGNEPITFNQSDNFHTVVRRPFSGEVVADNKIPPGGGLQCTYFSSRRFVRAFVDHRLTGGLLSRRIDGPVTRNLINDAGVPGIYNVLRKNGPDPGEDPEIGNPQLKNVLAKLFGERRGKAAHFIWNSNKRVFQGEVIEQGVPESEFDGFSGMGAPGAAVYLELADYAFVTPKLTVVETNNQNTISSEAHWMVQRMKTELVPGDVLQFWRHYGAFARLWHQSVPAGKRDVVPGFRPGHQEPGWYSEDYLGHSIIFHSYWYEPEGSSNLKGLRVIDYDGSGARDLDRPTSCEIVGPANNQRIEWWGMEPDVWIAAHWFD